MVIGKKRLWLVAILACLLTGGKCVADETLTLEGPIPRLILDNKPDQKWTILGDKFAFEIDNSTTGFVPFKISPEAPDGSLFIGNELGTVIGIGTVDPKASLHIARAGFPTLRLEQSDAANKRIWDLEVNNEYFVLRDSKSNTSPLFIETGAPNFAMVLNASGSVGLGTDAPELINSTAVGSNSRHLNLYSLSGTARHIVQGQLGAESFHVHTGGVANQRIARTRVGNGKYYISAMRDNLTSFNEGFAFTVDLSNGNVGIKTQSPAFPLQVGDSGQADGNGARCTVGGVWTNASSRSVKQDIEPITSEQARETVRALTPVGYRYKNELDEHYIGFIAEDVPELVATKDRKSLATMDITAVLTKVVQDQDRQLDEQRQVLDQQRKLIAQQQESLATQQATMAALAKRLTDLEEKLSNTGAASR